MKFSHLRKAAVLSLFAAGAAMPEAYAANPTNVNGEIDTRRGNGDSFQSIFDWLRTESFTTFMPLFESYKYFFDLLPGWATAYLPDPPSAFPLNPKTAGALYAAPVSPIKFTGVNYVVVNAEETSPGVWDEVISVGGNPQIPSTPVPIDGGASLLLAAGAAYGLKRFRGKKTSDTEQK